MRECSSEPAALRRLAMIGATIIVSATVAVACQHQAPLPPALTPASPTVTKIADVGLNQPANVVYDSAADLYYVSNMGPGATDTHDDNGFISQIGPDGRVVHLRWIAGGQNGAVLDAPRGMAICADTLVVADVGSVHLFNRKTGAWVRSINMPATRLTDVACAKDGALWVTDAGPVRDGAKLDTTEDLDAVWRVGVDHSIVAEARGLALQGPGGIVMDSGAALVATFDGNRLERVVKRDPKARPPRPAATVASAATSRGRGAATPARNVSNGTSSASTAGGAKGASVTPAGSPSGSASASSAGRGGRGAGRGAAPAAPPGPPPPPDSAHVVTTLPVGQIDALRRLPNSSLVATSWEGHSVYLLGPNDVHEPLVTGITSPSGVAVDSKRHRLVITSTQANMLYFAPLPTPNH